MTPINNATFENLEAASSKRSASTFIGTDGGLFLSPSGFMQAVRASLAEILRQGVRLG